ncbi:two-component response regulator-like protein [Tasmannia lanceolata]|uniref:two-component response regulator-like protein n=1 Tax=Tasmannia lanceolata TaxID=3420 RepID=UPI004063ABBF
MGEIDGEIGDVDFVSGEIGGNCFLPRMFLRVLLVESDDSTRQIISALLRKCNYKVAAVADGLKAWEALKEKPHNIDLILTEVELPSMSGFSLLNMIMAHETCKNIPVIMMSSHDSISVVFKCMLRGAADFLVKPIRKNELRNLWQHVWRRHSSSGGGHAGRDGNLSKRKFDAISENNAASNHSSDFVACMLQNRECSEKGSDAQSSSTKLDTEAESACMHNRRDLLQPNCWSASLAVDTGVQRHGELVKSDGTLPMQESLAKGKSNGLEAEATPCNQAIGSNETILAEKHTHARLMTRDEDVTPANYREDASFVNKPDGYSDKHVKPSREAINFIGAIDDKPQWSYHHADQSSVRGDIPNDLENLSNAKNGICKLSSSPFLELSLRRSQPTRDENQEIEERHILNHSNASAFSRYNKRTVQPTFLSSTSFRTELREHTSGFNEYQSKNGPDHANDAPQCDEVNHCNEDTNSLAGGPLGQDKTESPCPPVGIIPVPGTIGGMPFDGLCAGYGTLLQPMFYAQSGPFLWGANATIQQEPIHATSSHQSNPEVHNSEQNHHPNDQTASKPNYPYMPRQEHGLESKEDPNSSGGGSVCNGSNRNVTAAAVSGATAESGNNEGLFPQDGIRVLDYQRSSQREAALNKFRLKRKDRCFEKKVRYQSRKRLAEQRPRVKGQFVRQV